MADPSNLSISIHVYHHFENPLTIILEDDEVLEPAATKAVLAIVTTGDSMSTSTLTVDTVNARAILAYVDDKGDTNAAAPAGVIATYSSDNPGALTIDESGAITVVGEGVASVGVVLTDASGSPLLEADGVTEWAPVGAVLVTVDPGAPVGAQLSVIS